ncbi:MAG: RNA 2',3'-cyclic phosphodiesterase [Parcubacteria group bacterium]|nr:RNA 2',3'-cyclic phosphodiesterase [Parcubacteria group bacterium]
MRSHRLFFAVTISEDVKEYLLRWQRAHSDLPVRWTRGDAMHVTAFFIGHVDDGELARLATDMKQTLVRSEAFDIPFTTIRTAPDQDRPRMLWYEGEESSPFHGLVETLDMLASRGRSRALRHALRPHVTLGRIRQRVGGAHPPMPHIKEAYASVVSVDEIQLIESIQGREGYEYACIQSVPLNLS